MKGRLFLVPTPLPPMPTLPRPALPAKAASTSSRDSFDLVTPGLFDTSGLTPMEFMPPHWFPPL